MGPAWYFDSAASTLYLRVVNPQCYNKNDRGRCDTAYNAGEVGIPNIVQGFIYQVSAACSGCAIQKSYAGVDYFDVPNNAPATRFATDYGALRTAPPAVPWEDVQWAQCAAPAPAPADPPSDAVTTTAGSSGNSLGGSSTGPSDNAAAQTTAALSWMVVAALGALAATLQL